MVITIEPFICAGSGEAAELIPNSLRSVKTKDNSLAAFWEHVVAVTKDGCEVLDLRPGYEACALATVLRLCRNILKASIKIFN